MVRLPKGRRFTKGRFGPKIRRLCVSICRHFLGPSILILLSLFPFAGPAAQDKTEIRSSFFEAGCGCPKKGRRFISYY